LIPRYVINQASGHTTPHPTIILTNRLIRHYEDPTTLHSRQITLRNIAYLHAVYNHVVVNVVSKRYPVLHSNATPIMHAILARSDYNHNKHLITQHVPRKIIKKLPRVVLT
jgi:hypothetical protein